MGFFKNAVAKAGSASARANIRMSMDTIRANPNNYPVVMKQLQDIIQSGKCIMLNIMEVERVSFEQADYMLATMPRYAKDLEVMQELTAFYELMGL